MDEKTVVKKAIERSRGAGGQILLGLLLASVVVVVLEASTTYDEECGRAWAWTTNMHVVHDLDDGGYRVRISHAQCRFTAVIRGDVRFSADEREVVFMGPDALLEIEERVRGERRRLEARPGPDGEPEVEWFVNRRPAELDDEAREWLRRVVPKLFRTTGLDVAGRVARLLERGGVDGVLEEIREIPGDHVQRLYLEQLLAAAETSPEETERVIRAAAQLISSDYEQAELLSGTGIPAAVLDGEGIRSAYVEAARTIASDYEMRRTLESLLETGDAEAELFEVVLQVAVDIGSDYELTELLVTVAEEFPEGRELPAAFAQALSHVASDYNHQRVLVAAFRRPTVGPALDDLLSTAAHLGGDYALAETLIELVRWLPAQEPLPLSFFEAVASVGSDYEHHRVLSAVVERPQLSEETVRAILRSSHSINSDHEQAGLLSELAAAHPVTGELRQDFEEALAWVGTKHAQEQVREALERDRQHPVGLVY